jgi:cellobiose-specific phosphotransferase system component IIB
MEHSSCEVYAESSIEGSGAQGDAVYVGPSLKFVYEKNKKNWSVCNL